jgi:uncharacterized protein (DUF427 family)
MRPKPIKPEPGQESVWDYPRPPRFVPFVGTVRVVLGGQVIAETTGAIRVLETSHPPVFYLPLVDVADGVLEEAPGTSYCEWKGAARYWHVKGGDLVADKAGWSYPEPTAIADSIKHCVGFYAGKMDACFVNDERVVPQPGGFYGGWITSNIVGPFKGEPGSWGW